MIDIYKNHRDRIVIEGNKNALKKLSDILINDVVNDSNSKKGISFDFRFQGKDFSIRLK